MPKITRRQFMKYVGGTAAALGISEGVLFKLTEQLALAGPSAPTVVWLQGGACTGCSVSLANVAEDPRVPWVFPQVPDYDPLGAVDGDVLNDNLTTVEDVVLNIINLQYHQVLQAASGDLAIQDTGGAGLMSFFSVPPGSQSGSPFVVAVEGTLPNDAYCTIGSNAGVPLGIRSVIQNLAGAAGCAAFIAVGTCPSFGGWPGARSNPAIANTGTSPLTGLGLSQPIINVPGCPVQPEVLLLTVAGAILHVLGVLAVPGGDTIPNALISGLDLHARPLPYYADVLHRGPSGSAANAHPLNGRTGGCPHYNQYSNGVFATKPGDEGCLITIGCKGLSTKTPCNVYGWNHRQGIAANATAGRTASLMHCPAANHPCYGCTEKGAPDKMEPFVKVS